MGNVCTWPLATPWRFHSGGFATRLTPVLKTHVQPTRRSRDEKVPLSSAGSWDRDTSCRVKHLMSMRTEWPGSAGKDSSLAEKALAFPLGGGSLPDSPPSRKRMCGEHGSRSENGSRVEHDALSLAMRCVSGSMAARHYIAVTSIRLVLTVNHQGYFRITSVRNLLRSTSSARFTSDEPSPFTSGNETFSSNAWSDK